ncbi:pyridoxal phosphate-dependent transferase [Phlyctochytrium arcticum]|nr:pyridoxal phosphate-dependent transferase [Phlyctochytrium arcticum]
MSTRHFVADYPKELGLSIPENTPHAVSVTLPTWADNVGYEEGEERVLSKLRGGYPRFVYHPCVVKLATHCQRKFAKSSEACILLPTRRIAQEGRDFVQKRFDPTSNDNHPHRPSCPVRIAELTISSNHNEYSPQSNNPSLVIPSCNLYVLLFPTEASNVAKQFWQHSGEGISSRFAEHCLKILEANDKAKDFSSPISGVRGSTSRYRKGPYLPEGQQVHMQAVQGEAVSSELSHYVEERFGRNYDIRQAEQAKVTLRKRIAGLLGDSETDNKITKLVHSDIRTHGEDVQAIGRGVLGIQEEDVYLFASGMSAIYNAHRICKKLKPDVMSVQYGFPYIDTLKIQEKFGAGCHFLGLGEETELDELEKSTLANKEISAVFCEFPSNPLLRSPDLLRLRRLADEHSFLLIVDETIGNFVNVAAIKWADMVVSSLTKIFSGDSNVMGGSLVLNPTSPRYTTVKNILNELYEDSLWCEDAVFLERNSRTFRQRIAQINSTTELLCDYLKQHPKVEQLHYPKYVDVENYHRQAYLDENGKVGFGGLFSIILKSKDAAIQFYNALEVAKGPSLGTNFTLVCPYTILAHYTELEWAAGFKVPERLVRVSVGLENPDVLLHVFNKALDAVS